MRTREARFLGMVILLLLAASSATAQLTQQRDAATCVTHVLFLGNSYTYFNNLPAIFAGLASAGHQCKADTAMVAPGGVRLKDLWEKPEAREALSSKKWDYVVLQDQSTLGVDYYLDGKPRVTSDEVFLPYAEKWAAEIVRHGARPIFYLTWARKATPEDQAALNYAYMHAAKEAGAIVAPVGVAWQLVRQQSPAIDLYYKDGSHPSPAGSYLAACVMFSAIFQHNPMNLPSRVSGPPVNLDTEKVETDKIATLAELPDSEAGSLQKAAWAAWEMLQRNGGYVDVKPATAPVPAFSSGEVLSSESLGGTWLGDLLFYPGVGTVQMVAQFRRQGDIWKGHLNINYPVKDFAPESFDLTDLQVGEREVTFSDPKSAGVNNWRIVFRGALKGGEVKGVAETKFQKSDSPPIIVLGDWTLQKQAP